jgi:hypothetical protein
VPSGDEAALVPVLVDTATQIELPYAAADQLVLVGKVRVVQVPKTFN